MVLALSFGRSEIMKPIDILKIVVIKDMIDKQKESINEKKN